MIRCLTMRGHEVDDTRGQAGLLGTFGDDVGLERSLGRRLHDHRTTTEQRRSELRRHDHVGHIPRRDRGDDTNRLMHDVSGSRGRTVDLGDERESAAELDRLL